MIQLHISSKPPKITSISLFAMLVTIILLSQNLIVFKFPLQSAKSNVQVVFLGSILDPLELDKIKSQNIFSAASPAILPSDEQPTKSRNISAPAKPNLSRLVITKHKNIFKNFPPAEEKTKTIPFQKPSEINKNVNPSQPYQRLRLYHD